MKNVYYKYWFKFKLLHKADRTK